MLPKGLPGGIPCAAGSIEPARVRLLVGALVAWIGLGWTTEVAPGPGPAGQAPAAADPIQKSARPPKPAPSQKQAGPAAKAVSNASPAAIAASQPETGAQAESPPVQRPAAARVQKVAAGGAVALAASLEGDAKATALVLTLTRTAKFATFTLADPYRVVIDLQDVEFRIASTAGTQGRGLVKSFRYGLLAPGKSRIVVDIAEAARIDKAEIVALRGAETVQLRLALVPTTRETFLAGAMAAPGQSAHSGPHSPTQGLPSASGAGMPPKRPKGAKPMIVLDPGHGGPDGGTLGSPNVAEKHVVLGFARLLRDRLRATGRFDVHMTRDIDVFVRLDDRVRIAREHGCDLFISLHTDSVPAQHAHLNVRGATVYTVGEGDARAQQLAEKENLSDVIAGVEAMQEEQPEVASILTDLMRRETATGTLTFTNSLLAYMRKTTGMSREPHRHANFRVLRAPDFPSVLVELGYLSNKEDEKLLTAKAWQEQTAGAITQAVETYFAKRLARSPQ